MFIILRDNFYHMCFLDGEFTELLAVGAVSLWLKGRGYNPDNYHPIKFMLSHNQSIMVGVSIS